MTCLSGYNSPPIKLPFRTLTIVSDLFNLCFELSLIRWLADNGQVDDPRELAEGLFAIPRDFRTSDLKLTYRHRCSDPAARVISFQPRSSTYRTTTSLIPFAV
jgi:hypothetical protein